MLCKILVPIRGDGLAEAVLGHAAALARLHGAHIVVAHCRQPVADLIPHNMPLSRFARETLVKQAHELAEQEELALRDALHGLASRMGLVEADRPGSGKATVSYIEETGAMPDVIKRFGRLADLIAVAKPDRDRNIGTNSLKSAVFRTGRAVLMCPPEQAVSPDLGRAVAIAWNGSLEATRAVAATLDIVRAADTVTILAGGHGEAHGATAEELVEDYAMRGVKARIHRFQAKNPGAALLDNTREVGAGLLIMGAYSHSHERETLFGGNTQAIVDHADLPVIMVH